MPENTVEKIKQHSIIPEIAVSVVNLEIFVFLCTVGTVPVPTVFWYFKKYLLFQYIVIRTHLKISKIERNLNEN
jgi:hypothetical protein